MSATPYLRGTPEVLINHRGIPEECFDMYEDPNFAYFSRWECVETQPTPAQVEVWALAYWKKKKRIEARTWAESINGRAYEGVPAGSLDDLITDIRLAVREGINDHKTVVEAAIIAERDLLSNNNAIAAVNAVLAGLSINLNGAALKQSFRNKVPEFNLMTQANLARKAAKIDINALSDLADVQAFEVSDAAMGAIHAAEYPAEVPTLAQLLVDFPVIED